MQDAEGRPILIDEIGASVHYEYDDFDNTIDMTFLDAERQVIQTEVRVTEVTPGTTAERIGLAPDDRLLSYDGVRLGSPERLVALTRASGPGTHVLVFRRGKAITSVEVSPGRLGVIIETVKALNPQG